MPSRTVAASKIKRTYFRPEIFTCPHCGTRLRRSHNAWNKPIETMNGVVDAWSMAYRCPEPSCSHRDRYYKSVAAERLAMKGMSYGYDVLAHVGELRFHQHRTLLEIHQDLTGRGIKVSPRHVPNLCVRYGLLLATRLNDEVRRMLAEVTALNEGIVLVLDGIQPERGNGTLYVLQEGCSGTVLAAKHLQYGSSEELQDLIRPIVALGYPIVGIVSDARRSIRLAFETLLPEVPYQYGQHPFLKDGTSLLDDH